MQTLNSVVVADGTVSIDHFDVRDADLARFLEEVPEEQRSETLQLVLRVGVAALRSAKTASQMDYVEKRFNELRTQFEEKLEAYLGNGGTLSTTVQAYFGEDGTIRAHLDGAFGEKGEFGKRLESVFGPQGALVKQLLDPANPASPLGSLKNDILTDLGRLRTELGMKTQKAEDLTKMAAKGGEFEDQLYELLGPVAQPHSDVVQFTGDEVGIVADCKKGDYTVTLSTRKDLKIVIEAKRRGKRATLPSVLEEMDLAIKNRDARYGVFVARNVGNLPAEAGWFNEYGDRILVLALAEGEEDVPRPELLEIGYRWARIRALSENAVRGKGINTTAIQQILAEAKRSLSQVSQMKGTCTKISDLSLALRTDLDEMVTSVNTKLGLIETELASTAGSGDKAGS